MLTAKVAKILHDSETFRKSFFGIFLTVTNSDQKIKNNRVNIFTLDQTTAEGVASLLQ